MEPLTYEQLFDILRREKSRDELQKLDPHFLEQVRLFLQAKQEMIEAAVGGRGLAVQRANIEHQNARRILRELYERREKKLVTAALHRTRAEAAIMDAESLLAQERLLFESLVHLLLEGRERIFSMLEGRAPIVVTPTSFDRDMPKDVLADGAEVTVRIRFLAPVPKFVGKDLRVFGPYEAGEQAELPDEVAQVLIRKGRAQELD